MNESSIPHADNNLDAEEFEALGRISHAILMYGNESDWEIKRWERNFAHLSPDHQALLPSIPPRIAATKQCVYQNHLFFKYMFEWLSSDGAPEPLCLASAAAASWGATHESVHPGDVDKVRYLLRNLMRDWSSEGSDERAESYGVICQELGELFKDFLTVCPPNSKQFTSEQQPRRPILVVDPPSRPRVLVPGCGLARLCVDLAAMGFQALGNEHNYYMLLTSAFILNATSREDEWTIFPWALNTTNQLKHEFPLRPVSVPDQLPSALMVDNTTHLLGMAAGEFVQVFSNNPEYDASFDAVATCFFIDTAHNVLDYIETIARVLKPGGWWVNLGPLQWHWTDAHTYLPDEELSIEVTLADVVAASQRLGFVFRKMETGRNCRYMSNENSMLPHSYECAYWVAQLRRE